MARTSALGLRAATFGLLVALAVAGCSVDRSDDGTDGDSATGETVDDTSEPQQLDCERFDHPCSWDEADPAATERTDRLLAMSSLLLAEGASAGELADRLEQADGVVEVAHNPITVRFRVDGAVPVFVHVDPTDGRGQIEGAPDASEVPAGWTEGPGRAGEVVLAQDSERRFTGCRGNRQDQTDGERGPVGTAGEPKRALILGPWAAQMGFASVAQELEENLKLGNSDYEKQGGGVTTVLTLAETPAYGSGQAVRLEDFCGWEAYDTIMVKTHGRTVCDDGRCFSGLSVGRFAESADELRELVGGATGVTVATSKYGNLLEDLGEVEAEQCIEWLDEPVREGEPDPAAEACLEQLPKAGQLEVTTDFFATNYSGGLKDRLIFLSACQAMAPRGGLARALRGSGESEGAILGFDRIITTPIANDVMREFAERAGTGDSFDQDTLDELNQIVKFGLGNADVVGPIEGTITIEAIADEVTDEGDEATRGADIVSLHHDQGGPELQDAGTVGVQGTLGDGEPDEIELGLRMTGLGEDQTPDDFEVEVLFDGTPTTLEDLDWDRVEEGTFEGAVVAELPTDVAEDATFDLEIRTPLPEADGAFSRWEYEDLTPSGCYFRFDHNGSVQTTGLDTYDGPVTGSAEFAQSESEGFEEAAGPDDPGGMRALNFDAGGQKVPAVTVIELADQDPLFRQVVLGDAASTRLPLGETGTSIVAGKAQLAPEPNQLFAFSGQFDVTVTDSSIVERAGRPFIATLQGTFQSAGPLRVQGLESEVSGEVFVTGGEFAFDADVCPGALP